MTGDESGAASHGSLGASAKGAILGAALGVITAAVPVLLVVATVVMATGTLVSFAPAVGRAPRAFMGGAFVGAGTVYLFGLANTFIACHETVDFCGGTSVLPLVLLATSCLVVGTIVLNAARRRTG